MQYLLGLDEDGVLKEAPKGYTAQQTHETYLGENRRANYSSVPTDIVHEWRLDGERKSASENILLESETGSISINAYASEVNLVLGSDSQSIQATVFVDDQEYKTFQVEAYQLYNLWESATPGKHKIEVKFSEPGVMAYAYTFG